MPKKSVHVPELGEVHLYKRRGMRSMRLSITSQGQIRVTLPYWLPYVAGMQFIESKKKWILSKRITPGSLKPMGRIGKANHLTFVSDANAQSVRSRIHAGGEIRVTYPPDLSLKDEQVQKIANKAALRALKQQASTLLPPRLAELAIAHGYSYNSVSVKQLKSRWGSCSSRHDITLNCYLMQLPWDLIDYVLLHELVHTKIMAHNQDFWTELGSCIDDLSAVRKKMRQYQPILATHGH